MIARRRLFGSVCTAAVFFPLAGGCPLEPLPGASSWQRHTISDDFSGADGVKLGDVDDDGLVDVAVGWEESDRVTLHLNPGPAAVTAAWPAVEVADVNGPEDALIVDLNLDGVREVVSAAEGARELAVHVPPTNLAQLLNPAAWQTVTLSDDAGARDWMQVTPLGVNASGGVDLVAGAKGGNAVIGWLEGPSDPDRVGDYQFWQLAEANWIMSIVVVDVNADQQPDIIYSDREGDTKGVYLLTNPGDNLLKRLPWPRQQIGTYDDGEIMFLDVTDLDADGVLDVVAATDRRTILRFERAFGGLTWTRQEIPIPDAFGTGKAVKVADIDGDGQADIVFTCENAGSGRFGVGYLSRTGALGSWSATAIGSTAGSKFDLVQVLDLDDDGDLDVLTTEESTDLGVIWYENPLFD